MNDEKANEIIGVMKSHWPNWNFVGDELIVWLEELRKFDFEMARNAINQLYKSWTKERYPKMPQIMAAIRNFAKARREQNKRVAPLYGIFRQDGRPRYTSFWGDPTLPKQEIERMALRDCQKTNDMWGPGHYYMIFAEIPI